MSPSNTVKQEQFASMVVIDQVSKERIEASPTVDTVGFSTTVDTREPSTSSVETNMTHPTMSILDTKALSIKVKHYLKSNQIKWGQFSKLLLGVSQSRLSTLLNKPEPFDSLTRRVQALYERMDFWMRNRATYGNNPYYKDKNARDSKDKKQRKAPLNKKPRSLLEGEENIEMLEVLKEYNEAKKQEAMKDYNEAKNLLLIGSGELDLSEAGESSVQSYHAGDTLQKVVEECVITMDTSDYENDEILATRVVDDIQEGVSIKVSQDGENCDNDQMGGQGVKEGPLQVFMVEYPEGDEQEMHACQVFVETTSEEPGTVRLSLQEPGHE